MWDLDEIAYSEEKYPSHPGCNRVAGELLQIHNNCRSFQRSEPDEIETAREIGGF